MSSKDSSASLLPPNSNSGSASTTGSSKNRRSTVPDILPHQKSFENRYSHMIHKQILETSINMDALKRQLNVFIPISRSSSLQNEEKLLAEANEEAEEADGGEHGVMMKCEDGANGEHSAKSDDGEKGEDGAKGEDGPIGEDDGGGKGEVSLMEQEEGSRKPLDKMDTIDVAHKSLEFIDDSEAGEAALTSGA